MSSNYLVIDQVTGSIAELDDQLIVNKERLTEEDLDELQSDSGAREVAMKYGFVLDPLKIEIVTPEHILERYRDNNFQITEEDKEVAMLDILSLFSVLLETTEEHWMQGLPNDVY